MEMSSILCPLGSYLTHIEAQSEFWHDERLQVPPARRSPRASFSLIEASWELSVHLFKRCIWVPQRSPEVRTHPQDLFLNNWEGILWIVQGCRTSQPLSIHIGEGSIRVSSPTPLLHRHQQRTEAVIAPDGLAFILLPAHFSLCDTSC